MSTEKNKKRSSEIVKRRERERERERERNIKVTVYGRGPYGLSDTLTDTPTAATWNPRVFFFLNTTATNNTQQPL